MMRRREFLALIGGATTLWPMAAAAQSRVSHVGVLQPPGQELWQVFIEALRARGWIEGENLAFEIRSIEGHPERYPALAAEMVALRPDVIVAPGSQATAPLHVLTDTIPIVFTAVNDPVAQGFVASLARPGGNITGLTFGVISGETNSFAGKFLQLLQEARPGITRIALMYSPGNPGSGRYKADSMAVAPQLGITLEPVAIDSVEQVEPAFAAVVRSRSEALVVNATAILFAQRQKIIAFALERRLPTISQFTQMTRDGLLMSQAQDGVYEWRRVADYVDHILKGAKPADLPVEQPSKFKFVVNLKTAKALGLDLTPTFLARADEVIE
jgi:putative tryptophan/tyrosine transport system substrate-binding protein